MRGARGGGARGGSLVSKPQLVAFAGVACLVILAVFQAVRETHPDAVADRHHGAHDFFSRHAHESAYARRHGARGPISKKDMCVCVCGAYVRACVIPCSPMRMPDGPATILWTQWEHLFRR